MKVERDPRLAEALRRDVGAPPFDDGFAEGLWRRIDEDAAGRRKAGLAAVLSGVLRVGSRRRYLLATAAAAAALVVALALTGVPGLGGTQPAPATAAMRVVAAMDAGLARVQTFQGTIVFDGTPAQRSLGAGYQAVAPLQTASIVLRANGDSYLDVRYGPVGAAEVAQIRHEYRLKLAYWRRVLPAHPKGLTAAQITQKKAQRRDDLLLQRSVTERCVCVSDETAHRLQIKEWMYDVFTGRFLGIRYKSWHGFAGVRDLGQAEIGIVLSLATQVRSALADRSPDVAVSDTSYAGRPAQLVVMRLGGGAVWRAVVDRTYGVVLSFQRAAGSPAGGPRFVAFHIVGAAVNGPVAAARFVLRPDYRYTPDGTATATGAPDLTKYNVDITDISYIAPSELRRRAEDGALAPAWAPSGYRLAEVGVSPSEGPGWTTLIYRRGLSMFSVESDAGTDSRFDVFHWAQLQGPVLQLHGGALSGWPAETTTLGLADATTAWPGDWGEGLQAEYWGRSVVVEGDLSHGELLQVADSLRPVNGRSPHAGGRLTALAALMGFLALAIATVAIRAIRRRVRPDRHLLLAVAGCLGVAAGLGLDWHAMAGAGSRFATSGWSETPGLLSLACALAALCAAAWQPAAKGRAREVLAGLVAPLATLALCAVGGALVYLPASARFTTDTAGLSVVQQYVLGRSSVPTPGLGMLVSAAGAVLLLASALTLRRRAARERVGMPDGAAS